MFVCATISVLCDVLVTITLIVTCHHPSIVSFFICMSADVAVVIVDVAIAGYPPGAHFFRLDAFKCWVE